jgi:hypothetical protein
MAVTAQSSGTKNSIYGSAVTVTIATPAVFTKTAHGLVVNDRLVFATTGALPTGLTAGTTYYVTAVPTADTFRVSTTEGGSDVATTGTQSGTHTVSSHEAILQEISLAATFILEIDLSNLAAGDAIELRIYNKVLTGGTLRVVYYQRYADAQPTDDQISISVPVSNDISTEVGLRFTLKQAVGTARAIPWKILQFS